MTGSSSYVAGLPLFFTGLSLKQGHSYIVDIGTGRTGHDQAVDLLQGMVSIIISQNSAQR